MRTVSIIDNVRHWPLHIPLVPTRRRPRRTWIWFAITLCLLTAVGKLVAG